MIQAFCESLKKDKIIVAKAINGNSFIRLSKF